MASRYDDYLQLGGGAIGRSKRLIAPCVVRCQAFPVFLLTVYSKSQKANLTKAERNELKTLVPLLVKNYSKGRKK